MNIGRLKAYAICIVLGFSFLTVANAGIDMPNVGEKISGSSLSYDGADVPVWGVGDHWTYNMDLSYDASDASADLQINNLDFEVTANGSSNYTLNFHGDITGSVVLAGIIDGNLENTDIDGKATIRKSDLAIERLYDVHIAGDIKRQLVTNSFYVDMEMKQNVTPVASPYDFPINVNETWSVPLITFWLHMGGEVSLAVPYQINYDLPLYIESHSVTCIAEETVSVPAGTYKDAFHVSGDDVQYNFWFSPAAHNVIKASYDNVRAWHNNSTYWDIKKLDAVLIDTNFGPSNEPPYPPADPNPANGSTDVDVNADLSWTGGDPDGDNVVYDIYFGTESSPPISAAGWSGTSYDPGSMEYNTTYYWKIVAHDSHSHSTAGPIWTFSTKSNTNSPPDKPVKPSGPSSGSAGVSYSYSSHTIDADGDMVYYLFDWGDGSNSGWLGPYASGQEVNASHTWSEMGSYAIKVKAKDTVGAESEWSDTMAVSMPLAYHFPMQKILEMLNVWLLRFLGKALI